MKCLVPEISWHNRDPVLSLDIQCSCDPNLTRYDVKTYRLATGGTDGHVEIWFVKELIDGTVNVECVSDLKRHNRAVNVVRFSPNGKYLASGDDESALFIWKKSDRDDDFVDVCADEAQLNRDKWVIFKTLRGHLEDIQDLCWSRDSTYLVSGSVDNTAILWDVAKGQQIGMLNEHKGFVQGVAFDPKGQYIATLSTDRDLRIYNATGKLRVLNKVNRVSLKTLPERISSVGESEETAGKPVRLFHDDTLKTFSRRLDFSPDGEILFTPAGCLEVNTCAINVFYAFSRVNFSTPAVVYPLGPKTNALAIRCCPVLFKLRKLNNNDAESGEAKPQSLFALPYRMVFAVITQDSLILYDTQSALPFTKIANIHYTRLSDLSWSSDARLLMISSTDGFCSFATFREGELGEVYEPGKEGEKETAVQQERMDVEVVLQKHEEAVEPTQVSEEPTESDGAEAEKKPDKPAEKVPFVIRARSAKHGARKIEIITQPIDAGPEAEKCRVETAAEVPPNAEESTKTTPKKQTTPSTSPVTSPTTNSEANHGSAAPAGSAQKKRVPFQTLSSPKTYKKKPTTPSKFD